MKLAFRTQSFRGKRRVLLSQVDDICQRYAAKGYVLTVRQIFHQLVTQYGYENNKKKYDNLVTALTDFRYAGEIDWEHITDHTRTLLGRNHSESPSAFIKDRSSRFCLDTWAGQKYRPEVWIEKDALMGIITQPCLDMDVDYIAIKGYGSTSAIWETYKRFQNYLDHGQTPVILHLGDHDPSGYDMTRSIRERVSELLGEELEVRRLALNIDQIREYSLPPQFAKPLDPRSPKYMAQFGEHSWELDALDPDVLVNILLDGITEPWTNQKGLTYAVLLSDPDKRRELAEKEQAEREQIRRIGKYWHSANRFIDADPALWDVLDVPESAHDALGTWAYLGSVSGDGVNAGIPGPLRKFGNTEVSAASCHGKRPGDRPAVLRGPVPRGKMFGHGAGHGPAAGSEMEGQLKVRYTEVSPC